MNEPGVQIIRRRATLPYMVCGVVCVIYGLTFPVSRFWDYIFMALTTFIAYKIARGIWKDREIRIELKPDTGNADCDKLITDARAMLARIRAANERIADPEISAIIDDIQRLADGVISRLETQPDAQDKLRSFFNYYLPTTEKLLTARAKIKPGESADADDVVKRCDAALPEIALAFERQLEALDKHKYLDLQVEMDVLESMLKNDK